MKIAIIGVGSFVFGPSALHDAIVEQRFAGAELALYDPNVEGMELMAGVGRQMAKVAGVEIKITTHKQLADALSGADFVVSSAAVQVQRRFAMDCEIIQKHYPEHLITEFGGVQGISYTVRQVALLADFSEQMKKLCPKAWLLTASNPLPRVCEAVSRKGIKVAGLCSNSSQVLDAVGRVMMGASEHYPWPTAAARYRPVLAGVNHFTWMLQLVDKQTGSDVNEEFIDRLKQGVGGIAAGRPMTMDLLRGHKKYPPNGDGHMADFVKPTGQVKSLESSVHGTAEERAARGKLLADIAAGKADYRLCLDHRAWEKPMDVVAAIAGGNAVEFMSLNLVNEGQIPQLPEGVFVETPVKGVSGRVVAQKCDLPEGIAEACRETAMLHSLLADACVNKDSAELSRAVELDPTILDKAKGKVALNECLKAHADLIGHWPQVI